MTHGHPPVHPSDGHPPAPGPRPPGAAIPGPPPPGTPFPLQPGAHPGGPGQPYPGTPGQPAAGPYPGMPGQSAAGPYPGIPYPPRPPAGGSRSRRGLWIGVGAGALALALCAGAAVGVGIGLRGDDGDGPAPKAAAANGVTVTNQELDDLLERHTRALADKDLKTFLAPFDPTRKELVAGQTQLFTNLGKLPLAVGRYQTIAQQGRASDAFGRGVTFQLDVSFVHQFEGYDVAPVTEWYRWTIVREGREAPIRVTAVTGAPASATGSSKTVFYPGPWDKWRDIHVERTAHTLVIADSAQAATAKRYAPVAEAAVAEDLAAWRAGGVTATIPKGFVISLVRGKDELGSLYRVNKEKTVESGVSIGMLSPETRNGKFVIGGSRVVLDTADRYFFGPGAKVDAAVLFRHELAHSLVATLTDVEKVDVFDGLDKWIVEGFAEYLGHRGRPLTAGDRAAQGRALVRSGGWDGKLPGNVGWDAPDRASFHYWLGHTAMTYLAKTYGEQKLFQFVAARYAGSNADQAARDVLGVPLDEFEAGWASFVRAQAR